MRQDQEMIRPTLRKAEHFNVSPERYKQQAWRHAAIRLCIDPMVIAACVLGLVVPVAVAYVMKDPAWIFLGYGSIVLVGITAGIRAGKHVPSEVPPMCRKCGFDLRGTDERE
ncbi:MAG TPA: hypothetical protein VG711_05465, partial [Phycisphaerales bacterium]|nr:hypothetical protein [Phycisphaerales bacterium]